MLDMPRPSEGEPPTPSRAPGQRLWAVLLVLDAFFVIVFGGALAAKLYQHSQVRLSPAPAAKRLKNQKTSEAKPPAPAPAAAVLPAPPKSEPPIHEPAKPRQAQETKPEASSTAAAVKTKAVPVTFQLKAPGAKHVDLAGPFIVRGAGRKAMLYHADEPWNVTIYLTPNTYRYHFIVDGKKTLDPGNPRTERGASVITIH